MPATRGASRSRGAPSRAKAASNGNGRSFEVRGVEFTLPKTVPLRVAKLYDDGEIMGYLEAVLGDEQMEKLWAMELPTGKMGTELEKLLVEVVKKTDEKLGIGLGE